MTTGMTSGKDAKRLPLWIALVAVVAHLGFAAGGVWSFDTINYDDPQVIALVKDSSVADLLTGTTWYAYKPLYFLSLKIDSLFGDNMVAVAHIVNVLLHGLATLLLVKLLFRLFGSLWVAGAAGLLFAVHPVHVENIAWLSERKDTLSLVFALLAHLSYRKRRESGGAMWVPALLLLLGGLTKGTVWTYAFIIGVDALVHAAKGARLAALKPLVPVFAVGLGGIALDFTVAMQSGAAGVDHGVSTMSLAAAMAGVHLDYARHLVLPLGLSLDYAVNPDGSWAVLAIGGALLALAVVFALVDGLRRARPVAALAAAFWIFGLAPVNNILPRTAALMADRYLYIPAIGFYIAVAFLLRRTGKARTGILAGVALGLFVLCQIRTGAFANSNKVWTDAIDKVPTSALARLQRGQDHGAEQRYPDALKDADAALALKPRPELEVRAHLLKCAAMLGMGESDKLLEQANIASNVARALGANQMVRDDPSKMISQAEIFRGQALERQESTGAALKAYESAVTFDDESWSAHFNYGTLLASSRNEESLGKATGHLQRALDLNPGYLEGALQLAAVFGRRGDKARALSVLERAESRHGANHPDILYARATIHLEVGNDWSEAMKILRQLREVNQDHPKGRRLDADIQVAIGRAYIKEGRRDGDDEKLRKAIGKFDEALDIRADYWEAHLLAGDAFAERGLLTDARNRYREARDLAKRERWIEGVLARTGALQAAMRASGAETDDDIIAAAGIMAGVVRLDIARLDLGFTPLEEELPVLREVARVLDSKRMPEAEHAAVLLASAAMLVTGDEFTALRDLKRVFGQLPANEREPALLDAALLLRALLYLAQSEFDAAADDFKLLAQRRPKDVLPQLRLLQIDHRKAQARLSTALGFKEDRDRLARTKAEVAAVARRVREFADAHPTSSTAGLQAVQADISTESWIPALRRLNEMEERFPRNASVQRGYSAVYTAEYTKTRDRTLIEAASRALHMAMSLDQRDPRTLMDASQLARVAGDLGSAVKHAERARELESRRNGPASLLLGDLHIALGRKALEGGQVKEVRGAIAAARRIDRTRAGSWILEGELALKSPSRDRFVVAYKLAKKAKELEPYHPEVNPLLAKCHRANATSALMQMGRYRVPKKDSKVHKTWQALTEDERATRTAALKEQRDRLRRQAIYDLEQALLLDPQGEDAKEIKRQVERLREADPASAFERRQNAQKKIEEGNNLLADGKRVDALYAYLEAVQLQSSWVLAQGKVLNTASNLLLTMPLDVVETPDGRAAAERYLELSFRSLHALEILDTKREILDLFYLRGLLNDWIFKTQKDPDARDVARLAAVRAYEHYVTLLGARTEPPEPSAQEQKNVRYTSLRIKRLRQAERDEKREEKKDGD